MKDYSDFSQGKCCQSLGNLPYPKRKEIRRDSIRRHFSDDKLRVTRGHNRAFKLITSCTILDKPADISALNCHGMNGDFLVKRRLISRTYSRHYRILLGCQTHES